MADNVTIPASGTGTSTPAIATDDVGGVHYQKMKLDLGGDGVSVPVTGTVPVSGSITASGTVTANIGTTNGLALDATLTGGTQKTKIVDTGGTNVASVSAAGAVKVDGSAVTQPVSGTVTTTPPANASTNVAQVAGTTTDTNSGNKSAGTLRVVVATDQPQLTNALKVDGSAVTQPVSGTVTANAGTGNFTVVNAGTFAIQDSEKVTDRGTFTQGTTKVLPVGYILDDTIGTALTENMPAAARINLNRSQVGVIEDGTTRAQYASVSAAGALKVDNSAVTQPVSGTVTANIGTSGSLALDATLTGGSQKSKLVDSGGTNVAAVSAAGRLSVDASGVAVPVTDNGGSLTVDGTVGVTVGTAATDLGKAEDAAHTSGDVGVLALGVRRDADTTPVSADGDYHAPIFDAAGNLKVNVKVGGGGSGGTASADDSAFTPGTTNVTPAGYMADEVSPDSVDEGDIGVGRMSLNRNVYVQLRDSTAERSAAVTAANAVKVDGSGVTQPVSGTVTATLAANVTEDAASAGAETSVLIAGVRNDAAAAKTNADGDFGNLALDSAGRVGIADLGGSISVDDNAGSLTVDGTVTANAGTGPWPVTDNSGSLTVDAPVGTPVFARLSDGTAALTTTSGRLAVDPSGVTSPVSIAAAVLHKHDVVTAATAAWTSATSVDTTASITVTGYGTVLVSLNPTSTFTGGAIIFEISDDAGTTWYPIQGIRADSFVSESSYTIVASTKRVWQFSVAGATNFRVRLNPAITGTGTANLRIQASAAAVEPGVTVGGTVTATWATAGGKTPAFASVSATSSGQTQIVAADATRKIKVVSYVLVADAAVTAKWQSASTDLTGAMSLAANGGVSAIGSFDSHILETVANQALNINLGGAVGVRGHISYFIEA